MSVDADHPGRSGGTLADTGHLLERLADAVGPASPILGRVAAVVSIVQLGARLVPAAGRLVRRYPVGSALVAAGILGAAYLLCSQAISRRSPWAPRSSPQLDPRLEPRPGSRTEPRREARLG